MSGESGNMVGRREGGEEKVESGNMAWKREGERER